MRKFKKDGIAVNKCIVCSSKPAQVQEICSECNAAIILLHSNAQFLRNAASYLEHSNKSFKPKQTPYAKPEKQKRQVVFKDSNGRVTVFADGSCLQNGSKAATGAGAAIIESNGSRHIVAEFLHNTTNQQAEIVAAAIALESIDSPSNVTLYSDSMYVIKTMTGAYRRKANLEFWKRLDEAAKPHVVKWLWIKGHNGHPMQEAADDAARYTAELRRVDPRYFQAILDSM